MQRGALLESNEWVRGNSLVLSLVTKVVEVPQDSLAVVEVSSINEGGGEG